MKNNEKCGAWFFGIIVLVTAFFFVLVGRLFTKGKNAAWKGEVIDKSDVARDNPTDDLNKNSKERLYSIKVKLDNGQVHNLAVRKDFYEEINIGDKLEKEKGALWPKKI